MVDENKENINKPKSEDTKKVTSNSNDGNSEKKVIMKPNPSDKKPSVIDTKNKVETKIISKENVSVDSNKTKYSDVIKTKPVENKDNKVEKDVKIKSDSGHDKPKLNKNPEEINNKNKLTAKKKDIKNNSNTGIVSEKKKNSESDSDKSNESGDLVEKLVSINRVAKVVKGGRRFSFAALVVVGDANGLVGHGKGKAKEVPEAIKKATDEAKNNMIRVPLRQGRTLHHDIYGRYDSGKVYLRSAPSGTGVIAGGPMRAVFEALGIQDIVAKSVGTSNPHNMVRATFEALRKASSPKIIALRRGLKINEITKRRKGDTEVIDGKN